MSFGEAIGICVVVGIIFLIAVIWFIRVLRSGKDWSGSAGVAVGAFVCFLCFLIAALDFSVCPVCGERVNTDYCTYCGQVVEENINQTCPECGNECRTDFCGDCGAPMNSEGN